MRDPLAIYFHWPYCLSKCPYCDFNVHLAEIVDHAAWREAYLKSIYYYAKLMPDREVISVFFGGGTPSLMEPETVRAVLQTIRKSWPCASDMEVTLEANPTSVETEKFRKFAAAGINRVSLGVQSLNDEDLKFLGRKHDSAQALTAVKAAKDIFDRVSFDLIYARPEQTPDNWREELSRALELACGHMSLYQLTIERSTPFYFDHAQGKFAMPDDARAADFYAQTAEIMDRAGLPAYEVSNHARPGQESRHNLAYWRYGDYVGIGPGAHGRLTLNGDKFAAREHSAPEIWLRKLREDGHARHPMEKLSPHARFTEALMMGLRLREGASSDVLEKQGQRGIPEMLDMDRLDKLSSEGLLSYDEKAIRLTREGMLKLNAVIGFILK